MSSCSLLVKNAYVVTMNPDREIVPAGFVAIDGDRIIDIGASSDCSYVAERTIDAGGAAMLPGFVNAHTHSLDALLRGGLCDDRGLYDWLTNIVDPGGSAYQPEDITTVVELYTLEAVRSGITTVVDNVETPFAEWERTAAAMIGVYGSVGLRLVYAQMFYDHIDPSLLRTLDSMDQRPPERRTDFGAMTPLDDALAGIESVMATHHGSHDGRVSVWPAPGVAAFCSREAFLGAADLASRYGAMTTVHVCESSADEHQGGIRSVQYLSNIGYLGPEVLAAHCVQTDISDIWALARSGTKVATNPVSNMFLGNGIAPVAEMLAAGITVGIGTDDANCNGTVNMLADLKFAALAQKARYRDASAITAERVLEMATIDGAAAIGMADSIGSIEPGKKADVILIDLSPSHLSPRHNIASVLVYQTLGCEVQTVVVDGHVVLDDGRPTWLDDEELEAIPLRAQQASERIAADAELPASARMAWRT